MKLEFWFDFASTYSYLSVMRVEELVQKENIDLHWRPFLLGAIFNKQGWNDSPFNIYPVKGRYMWRDMARLCEDLGILFKKPTQFPRNGLLAARITTRFFNEPWVSSFIKAIFKTNFQHDEDIAALETVSECLTSLKLNAEELIKEATSQESKDLLRKQTDEAFEKGIFGAPSFLVGDELFWGNDRLENAIACTKKTD